jgi:hypothetical protein
MTSSPHPKRKSGGLGKWITLLAVLVFVGVAIVLIGQPIREAKRTEQALIDQYGFADSFVPAPDGSIPPDRVEAFLRVREQVFEQCPEFQERIEGFFQVDSLEQDEGIKEAVASEEGRNALKNIFGLGRAFLRFMQTRNHALLEQKMGLGEYIYIYCLAYRKELAQVKDSRYAGIEHAYVGNRARRELIKILQNQLEALTSGDSLAADINLAADLEDQIAGLSDERLTLPWEGELPPAIAASFKPYQEPLARLYCGGIAKMELMQKNRGLNVKN